MQALTKKPMKPRRTPCFFSKLSLYSARSAMTWLMSTSLKVVSWAAVFCDSFSRSAMVLRSPAHRDALFAVGARARAGVDRRGCRAGRGTLGGAGFERLSTSPFSTRPSRPVPATEARSTPLSSAMRRVAA